MRVRVTVPATDVERLKIRILEGAEKVESEDAGEEDWVAVCLFPCHLFSHSEVSPPDTTHRSRAIPSHE